MNKIKVILTHVVNAGIVLLKALTATCIFIWYWLVMIKNVLNRHLILITILAYTLLHGFFSICEHCLMDRHYWTPYYLIDGLAGGGVVLWFVAYKYCKAIHSKYSVPAFATTTYAAFMLIWNIVIPALGLNRSDSKWSFLLTMWLIPVVYWTLFFPGSRFSKLIDNHLKRFNL